MTFAQKIKAYFTKASRTENACVSAALSLGLRRDVATRLAFGTIYS